jgi:hypothetical protein
VYFLVVILTTLVLPMVSILAELLIRPETGLIFAVGKWFVFWAVGVRLLLAGCSQAFRPAFTASEILGIEDPGAEKVVSELGYANLSIGLVGALSVLWQGWIVPAGVAGSLFLGLADLTHAANAERNAKENVAMTTDLFVAVIVATFLVCTALGRS